MPDKNPTVKINPTVGRIVYYKTRGSADNKYPPTDFAAIITHVHITAVGEAPVVALATFGPSGLRFEQSVRQGDKPGEWDWMPFQKDQVARLAEENKKEVIGDQPIAEEKKEAESDQSTA